MNYIGTCRDDVAWSLLFSDASDMACVIDNSTKLDLVDFTRLVNPEIELIEKCDLFGFNKERNIAWAYDEQNDIHYFWN